MRPQEKTGENVRGAAWRVTEAMHQPPCLLAPAAPPRSAHAHALTRAGGQPTPPRTHVAAVDAEVGCPRLLRRGQLAAEARGGWLLGQPLDVHGRVLALDNYEGHRGGRGLQRRQRRGGGAGRGGHRWPSNRQPFRCCNR